jgi:hypothetical protein
MEGEGRQIRPAHPERSRGNQLGVPAADPARREKRKPEDKGNKSREDMQTGIGPAQSGRQRYQRKSGSNDAAQPVGNCKAHRVGERGGHHQAGKGEKKGFCQHAVPTSVERTALHRGLNVRLAHA